MRPCLNEETLQAYLDGEASADVAGAAISHLAECAHCAARAREAEQALAAIGGALDDELSAVVPAARLRARIESALAESATPKFSLAHLFRRVGLIAAPTLVVAGLVVAGVIGLIVWIAFGTRSSTNPGAQQPGTVAREKESNAPLANPPGLRQPTTSPAPVRDNRRGKPDRHRSVRKPAPDLAQTSLLEPSALAPAPPASFSEGSTFFDFETTRHLEKAQVLLRSFENASSSNVKDLAYEKQVSRELLLRNILLRREAEGSENAPAKSLLSSLEPLLLDIANLPARPAPGDLRSVKKRVRKSEIVVALQVYSTPTTTLD